MELPAHGSTVFINSVRGSDNFYQNTLPDTISK